MANTMVVPALLEDFPGSPFTQAAVDAAVEYIRDQAGWHIAPIVTETLVVDARGGRHLQLPTKQLISITAIRNITDYNGTSQVVTGWYPSATPQFKAGRITHGWSWPWWGALEVDVVHGYESCPADLLPVVAYVASELRSGHPVGQVSRSSVGSVSMDYNQGSLASFSSLGKYSIVGV